MGTFKRFGVGASAGALEPTSIPTTSVSGQTIDSVSFSITNTDIAPVTISWIIRLNNPDNGSPAANNTVSNIQPGATITAQATGLGSGLTFWLTSVFATATGRPQSLEATRRSTTTLVRTSTPGAIGLSSTADSVSFNITNNDSAVATINWGIFLGTSPAASSTQSSVQPGTTFTVSAGPGLAPSTTFVLKNVKATASGKIESFAAQEVSRTTLARVATPTTTLNSVTSSSVTFNIINNDAASASFAWILRQGSQTGNPIASDVTNLVPSTGSVSVGDFGLAASTTFWLTDVQGSSSGKAVSFAATPISATTSAPPPPPPFFPPHFPPPPPPFFPPFFPPDFTPFFPPFFPPSFPTFGGCLDINTPIHMYDGSIKILKDIEAGDELKGYYIPGMIHEDQPGWEDWTESVDVSGIITKTIVKAAVFDTFYGYYIINDDIHVTKKHPFLTNKKDSDVWAWVDTPDLEVGDYLKHINGDKVEIITIVYVGDPIYVKTLDVEELDNYTAGNMAVVIHNDVVGKT